MHEEERNAAPSPAVDPAAEDAPHAPYPRLGETSELAKDGVPGALCPRCGSWQVVAGHLVDGLGQTVRFALMYRQRAPGVSSHDAPPVVALYCNECGELTFTLG